MQKKKKTSILNCRLITLFHFKYSLLYKEWKECESDSLINVCKIWNKVSIRDKWKEKIIWKGALPYKHTWVADKTEKLQFFDNLEPFIIN
jgi:hypothetical protein